MFLEDLPVNLGLAVVALHKGPRRELYEVLVANLVLDQGCQVVVGLLAPFHLSPRVIHARTTQLQSLIAMLMRHVELATNDWLYTGFITFLIEVQNSVHIAVVGNSHCRLAIFDRRGHNITDTRRTVEHRILSVLMKMDK
ncbi:unannotated protein [freshwater metagenome]|uniref:Unannotated protein n=1 Tax=freshwater metagenome TaxID=449393 RepID=A0A6J6CL77_9ZZZZ